MAEKPSRRDFLKYSWFFSLLLILFGPIGCSRILSYLNEPEPPRSSLKREYPILPPGKELILRQRETTIIKGTSSVLGVAKWLHSSKNNNVSEYYYDIQRDDAGNDKYGVFLGTYQNMQIFLDGNSGGTIQDAIDDNDYEKITPNNNVPLVIIFEGNAYKYDDERIRDGERLRMQQLILQEHTKYPKAEIKIILPFPTPKNSAKEVWRFNYNRQVQADFKPWPYVSVRNISEIVNEGAVFSEDNEHLNDFGNQIFLEKLLNNK